jgi:hypothetical protein
MEYPILVALMYIVFWIGIAWTFVAVWVRLQIFFVINPTVPLTNHPGFVCIRCLTTYTHEIMAFLGRPTHHHRLAIDSISTPFALPTCIIPFQARERHLRRAAELAVARTEEGRRMNQRYIDAIADAEAGRLASERVVTLGDERRGRGTDTKVSPPTIDGGTKENNTLPSDHSLRGSPTASLGGAAAPGPESEVTEIPENKTKDTDQPTGNDDDRSTPAPAHIEH